MTTKNTGPTLYDNKEHGTDTVWQQRTQDRQCMTTKNTGQTLYDNKEHGTDSV